MSVVLLQTALPDYRQKAVSLLGERIADLSVVTGEDYFASTVRTALPSGAGVILVENRFFAGRRLLWQAGSLRPLLRAEVAVVELNPRILSTWLILVLRRLAGRETVLWGHAWPRSGRDSGTDLVRHLMRRLGSTIVVYTDTQAQELRARMPRARIVAAPNALYLASEMGAGTGDEPPGDFLFVGRLVPEKKPLLLLEAFLSALHMLPGETRLVFVGEGPLRSTLEEVARQAGATGRVVITGHISDIRGLGAIYARAVASVSPGYAGLSLVQSLAFGVPMIVARNEPHSPEIEAAVEGVNCRFFDSDCKEALAAALVDVAKGTADWAAPRRAIAADCATRYSLDAMVDRLVGAIAEARECAS